MDKDTPNPSPRPEQKPEPDPAEAKLRASFDKAFQARGIALTEPDATEKDAPGDDEAGGEGEDGANPKDEKPDAKAIEAAHKALKRYGMTDAMIAKLSPEEVTELGAHLAKIQADNDAIRGGKDTPSDRSKAKDDAKPEDTPSDDAPFTLPDDVVEELSEDVARSLSGAIQTHMKAQIDQVVKAATNQIAAVSSTVAQLQSLLEHELLIQARARFSKELPEILDDEAFEAVEAKMRELAKTKKFKNVDALMREAALGALGSGVKDRLSNKNTKQLRDAGQPRPVARNQDGRFSPDPATRTRAVFNDIARKHGIVR